MKPPQPVTTDALSVVRPFSDKIYLISAVLDPNFALMWIDNDVLVDEHEKLALKKSIKGFLYIIV